MDVAPDAAQPLVADLDLSPADVDAVIAATEKLAQCAVDHKTKIPPPPERSTLAGWAEWRRKVAGTVAGARPVVPSGPACKFVGDGSCYQAVGLLR